MKQKKLKEKYDELVAGIESVRMFDGRNKGVDVYVCDKCGHKFYTRYKDKGVTPFVIKCRNCEHGNCAHTMTISAMQAAAMPVQVHNWVRPTFEQLKKLNDGAIDHVLSGGLMLEDELDNDNDQAHKTIITDEEIKTCRQAMEKWGFSDNYGILVEECGELLSAINKLCRCRCSEDDVITELADVSLVITAFADYFGYDKFLAEKQRKLERLQERLISKSTL